MFRYSGQHENRDSVTWLTDNDDGQPDDFTIDAYSAVGQHSWVLGNNGLNQITGQVNHVDYLADVWSRATGLHYTRDFPNVDIFEPRLDFPAVRTGAGGDAGTMADRYVFQIKDDVSLLKGNHAAQDGREFQPPVQPGHPERERALRDVVLLRRPVGHRQQHQRPVSAGLPDAGHRPAVAAGERRRHQRPGILGGYAQHRAPVFDVVPGRLARDAATDAEPRRSLRRRSEPDGREQLRDQRHAAGARSDRPPGRRLPEDAEAGHLAARGICLRSAG